MILRASWLSGLPFAAAICALGALCALAPLYLARQGFPLDDAWIQAAYAREFARSGTPAYNPGVPATGESAPLWAAALVACHPDLVSASVSGMEGPLAALIVSGVILATVRTTPTWLVFVGALAVGARPEWVAQSNQSP